MASGQNGANPLPQFEPEKERVVFIPVTMPAPGQIHVEGVSFRGLPQRKGEPWSGWEVCIEVLMTAQKMAYQKLLEELRNEKRIHVPRPPDFIG